MPINEAGQGSLHLTEKQQREAMQSIYGLGGSMSPTTNDLTYEDRVRMRRLLDDLDQKDAGGMKSFDLAKPNVPAYQYREFPFVVYDHKTGKAKQVRNHEEREAAFAAGWSIDPAPAEQPEIELTEAEREEAAAIDQKARRRK